MLESVRDVVISAGYSDLVLCEGDIGAIRD